MARRLRIRRLTRLAACAVVAAGLGGCSSSNKIIFTNLSDSWLNVRFFVGKSAGSTELVSKQRFQVMPDETAKFAITRRSNRAGHGRLVHMQVESVTPSWEDAGKEYWMELLTEGSVKIVVRGKGEKLQFETGVGEVAHIPGKQLKRRFDYRVAGAPSAP